MEIFGSNILKEVDRMILELKNGQQINVIRILGGPRVVEGVERDTLSIEVDPSIMDIEDLRTIFSSKHETEKLYTYIQENGSERKALIGTGYTILLSTRTENRKVKYPPGEIHEDAYEEINVVNLAQMTYSEYQSFSLE